MTNEFDPRTYYFSLLRDLDLSDLQERIIHYLADHGYFGADNRCSRDELAKAMHGKATDANDRKNRKAKQGTLILSSSGKKGYYLPASQIEIDQTIQENNNRIAALEANNDRLRKVKLPLVLPERKPNPQMPLFRGS